jgi:hypothetical protein
MDNQVEITLGADASMLSVVRVAVGAIATQLDLGVDRLDDLQLAVEELCVDLIERGDPRDRLHVALEWDEDEIRCRSALLRRDATAPSEQDEARRALSRQILNALVDEHGETDDGTVATSWLRTRRGGDAT